MNNNMPIKVAMCCASIALFAAIPMKIAYAEESAGSTEQGVAGIAFSLDTYYSTVEEDEKVKADQTLTQILNTKVLSPYINLGVSIADDYVNVRSKPDTDSEVTGKLYRGCAANILERLEGNWVKIESGDVKGYIASDFLATGDEAEKMIDEYATKTATVDADGLFVRERPTTDSKILTQIPRGEKYIVRKENEEWVKILLGNDEGTGGEYYGFLSKDYLKIDVEFKKAKSIEEENREKAAEEARARAEEEQKQKLAQEKARKAQEEAERAEAQRKASQEQKSESSSKSSSSSSSSSSNSSSGASDVTSYALKFVGNRYVWGGTSLTNGADCSGFVYKVYQDFGYSLPRTSRDQAASAGRKVDISDRQPGDLIFYTNSSGTVNHVALYIGNNRIVQAANSRQGIITSQYNYRDVYCVRRVLD